MKCNKCGVLNEDNSKFCLNCGNDLIAQKNENVVDANQNDKPMTTSDKLESTLKKNNPFKPIANFIKEHKKISIIMGSTVSLFIVGFILFNIFYDFSKIKWIDKENIDTVMASTTVELNVKAEDKEGNSIQDINYSADGGIIESNKTNVKWTLPDKSGKYTIVAKTPSGKKIKKEIYVVSDNKDEPIWMEKTDEEDEPVNEEYIDSDDDGVPDKYEKEISKTDPNKIDTDGDGIGDGDELLLNLDPLKEDSKGDGIKDSDRTLTYSESFDNDNVEVSVTGKGNIASLTVDVYDSNYFKSVPGVIPRIYNFYDDGTMDNATVKIKYDIEEIEKYGYNEDRLSLYYFNEKTKELEKVETTIDKENKNVVANLTHFSKYLLSDYEELLFNRENDIMFSIDNSASMYTDKQMNSYGYDFTGTDGNDKDFKRIELTKSLINMLEGNYKFAISEFSGENVNLLNFTSDKTAAIESVESMKGNWHGEMEGTNIVAALEEGIKKFNKTNNNYLIIMTDGKNNVGDLKSKKDEIITSANNNNVKICSIGLGQNDSEELNEISEKTGCFYYNASDSSTLDEIYTIMGSDISYDMIDTDTDNKIDSTIIKDSGFVVSRDGFSFPNYNSTALSRSGNCYGMATFAYLRYKNQLPESLGDYNTTIKPSILKKEELNVKGYDLSNTYFTGSGNLYDFKFSNEILNNYFYRKGWPEDVYKEPAANDVARLYNDEYKEKLINAGIVTYLGDCNSKYKTIHSCEFPKYIDIYSEKFINNNKKDDYELLHAIYRLFVSQKSNETIQSSSTPDKFYDYASSEINKSNPIVLLMDGKHYQHAVNAIRLIQSNDNPNDIKIQIYDNNHPNEYRYIHMTRKKYKFHNTFAYNALKNEYKYEAKYDRNGDGEFSKEEKDINLHVVTNLNIEE